MPSVVSLDRAAISRAAERHGMAELALFGSGAIAAGEIGEHPLIAPSHLDVEVMSVVRGWALGRRISDERAVTALEELGQFGIATVGPARPPRSRLRATPQRERL